MCVCDCLAQTLKPQNKTKDKTKGKKRRDLLGGGRDRKTKRPQKKLHTL